MCGCKMPFSDTNLNVLDLCRLCLGKDNSLIPVFDNSAIGHQLFDKISVCLAVEIKIEDEVSQKICNHCLTKVNSFFDFRSTTLECQKVLQRCISKSNQNQLTFDVERDVSSTKSTDKRIEEKLTTEFDKASETDESEIDHDSRNDFESCNSLRNNEDILTRELKSLDSSVYSSVSNIVSPESEVPGPSGLQQGNKESPVIELKARYRLHNFVNSKGEVNNKKQSRKKISPADQDSKQTQNHIGNVCTPIHFKTAETNSKQIIKTASHEERENKDCTQKNLKCNLCQFTARYKSQLDIHIKRHKKDYKIFCDVCHKGFFYQYEVLMHKALHEEAYRFECNVCQKKFVYRHSLISHNKKHTEVFKPLLIFKPLMTFQCDKCGKNFSKRSYLKRHIDVHTGVNRVVCEVCGQVLCSPGALRSHSLTHTGERPFSCAVCSKSFTSKKYMIIHKRMHTGAKPFKCKVCEKSFTQQSSLIVHNRYHSGERPYQCHVCYKAFVTKTILKIHQKSHTA